MVNALAPALNTTPFTVTAEREMPVVLERANVAVSAGSLGTAAGVQLLAVFQSPEPGLVFHVVLPPKVVLRVESRSSSMAAITAVGSKRDDAAPRNVIAFGLFIGCPGSLGRSRDDAIVSEKS